MQIQIYESMWMGNYSDGDVELGLGLGKGKGE